jgi:hypothetical protein
MHSRSPEAVLPFTRRQFVSAAAPFALVCTGFAGAFLLPVAGSAWADNSPSPADLADSGPDGDITIGSDKAPVSVIEYASMTCPHCAHFSATTFPELQKRYIDTGKVRFTLRPFPLDALSAAGFMLARCGGKDKYMPIVEALFAKRADWIVKRRLPSNSASRGVNSTNVWQTKSSSIAFRQSATTPRRSSESMRRRLFSSMARGWLATFQLTRWPKRSTPISRQDNGVLLGGCRENVRPELRRLYCKALSQFA